jgi:hypothetical protein
MQLPGMWRFHLMTHPMARAASGFKKRQISIRNERQVPFG